ncbi:MAG: tetratricopeptide repeat protein [Muribaculaceae bacterium]|nr:tetratricopeptide repeat protein [Muribaculaceae bacterium]
MDIIKKTVIFILLLVTGTVPQHAQINADQVMRIGQNALYFEDYMLSIQYFNQAIQAKPYLAQPYFFRAIAKLNLDDYRGAEDDASIAIEHNPFITDAYEVRGVARQNLGKLKEAIADYEQALSMLPENRSILFNKALAEEEVKDYESARQSFSRLLKAHPNYDNGYIGRARLELSMGDTISALTDLNKALEINKNATNAYVMRADIAIHSNKDFAGALDDMNEAIKLQPKYAGFFINRAFLRYNLDDYFGAMADYDYALQLEPLNSVALFNRGLLRAEVHDNNKAIEDFSKVLSLDNNDYKALYNRALLYKDIRDYKNALADLNRVIEAFPSFAGAYFLRFEIYRQSGDKKRAERDYNKSMALAKKPAETVGKEPDNQDNGNQEDTEPQEVVANRFTSLLTIDNNAEVEEDYNNKSIRGRIQDRNVSIEIEPLFTLSYYSAPSQLKENTYFIKEVDELNDTRMLRFLLMVTNHEPQLNDEADIKRHFESIEYYNSLLANNTPRAIDYFGRAMDFMTLHNYKSAITDLDRAIELTPDFTMAYFLRAIAQYKETKVADMTEEPATSGNSPMAAQLASQKAKMSISKILADMDHVIKLSPRMAQAYYNKGIIYSEMQDYTSALSAYSKAIELKTDLGEAYYNRGYVYLKLGNKDAGIADLSKAGELGIIPSYNLLKRMSH